MAHDITIRHSIEADIDRILAVYDSAKRYMRATGNHEQWTGGYPSAEVILADIRAGHHYTATTPDGRIAMVFSFITGDDPTYSRIDGPGWLNDEPYGTIHRIASTGIAGGMLRRCVDFGFGIVRNIRIDTHACNRPMLAAIGALGFTLCGVIHLADGSPRTAFQATAPQPPLP